MTELAAIIKTKQVLAWLKDNNFVVIDDHKINRSKAFNMPEWMKQDNKLKINGVGVVYNDDGTVEDVVALLKGEMYYSTNALYIGNDGVHVSKRAVGPVVINDDIQKANDGLAFGGGIKIAHWEDGTTAEYKLGVNRMNKGA